MLFISHMDLFLVGLNCCLHCAPCFDWVNFLNLVTYCNYCIVKLDLWIYMCYPDIVNVSVQIGDLHFEPRERVRYTRDQLLELREVLVLDI